MARIHVWRWQWERWGPINKLSPYKDRGTAHQWQSCSRTEESACFGGGCTPPEGTGFVALRYCWILTYRSFRWHIVTFISFGYLATSYSCSSKSTVMHTPFTFTLDYYNVLYEGYCLWKISRNVSFFKIWELGYCPGWNKVNCFMEYGMIPAKLMSKLVH